MMNRNLLKPLILLFALLVGGLNSVWGQNSTTLIEGFEGEAASDGWTLTNIITQRTNSNVSAHGGSYYGGTNSKESGSIVTTDKISSPQNITFYVTKETNNNTASSWLIKVSTDGKTWTTVGDDQSASSGITRGTWTEVTRELSTYSNVYVGIFYQGTTALRCIDDVTLTYSSVTDNRVATATAIDASALSNTDVYGGTAAGTLAATVTAGGTEVQGATVTWSSSNESVATINESTGVVTLVAAGTTTITASYAGDETNYKASSDTYELTVTNTDPNAPGTVNNPYTVAQAIENTPSSGTSDNVYIKGIVSAFYNTSIVGDGSNYRYYISDDGTTTNQLLVYKGKGLNDEAFSSADDLQIGDEVVILGGLTTFSNASEVASGNYIVSLTRKPLINADDVNIAFNVANGNIAYEIANPASDGELTATTTATWLTLGTATETDVPFTATTNNGTEPRSAEVTLTYTYNTNETTTKVISVTQGIAIEEAWIETTLDKLTADDVFAIVSTKGNNSYAMSNDKGTSSAPSAVKVTVVEDKLTGTIEDNIKWNVVSDKDGYVFYPNGETTTWLYCTNTNNGVRVGTGDAKHFRLTTGQEEGKNGYLTTSETQDQRYLGVYNLTDWRCYDNINTNIQGQTFAFYKKATTTSVTISEVGYKAYNTIMATDFTKTEGLQAFAVTGYSESSVTLTEVETAPAGTPLVLKAAKGDYLLNAAATTPDAPAGNKLQVSDETVGDGATIYALANVGGEPGFYVVKSGLTIPTNYIVIPAGNAPALSFDFGEGTTGINSLTPALSEGKGVYTLDGRKLNAMPTQKGVYIVNGKKVVIK